MHIQVVKIAILWLLVRDSGKPRQTFLKYVDAHWVDAIEEDVDSQIEFQTVDQQRVRDVVLGNHMVTRVDVVPVLGQEDAFALGHAFGFDDEDGVWLFDFGDCGFDRVDSGFFFVYYLFSWSWCWVLKFVELISKFCQLVWKHIGFGKKVIIFGKLFLHQHEIFSQFIFMSYHLDSRPLGDSLIWLYSVQNIWVNRQIKPTNVKIVRLCNLLVKLLVWIHVKSWVHHSKP